MKKLLISFVIISAFLLPGQFVEASGSEVEIQRDIPYKNG
jgi:hypothetical protein